MDNNEKKIVENLDYMTQNTEVPESLKPENIEKMLRDHQLEQKKPKKTFHWKRAYTRAAAAVVFLSVIGAAASALKVDRTAELVSDYVPGLDNGRREDKASILYAENYDKVYNYIQANAEQMEKVNESFASDTSLYSSAQREDGAAIAENTDSAPKGQGYSDTNVRTEGVAEGDIVKTDGEFLYILKDTLAQINIVDIREEEMKSVATINLEKGMQGAELYVQGKHLIVLGVIQEEAEDSIYQEKTCVLTYDIQDRENVKKIGRVTQSGSYDSSRISDGYLYVFSNFYASADCKKNEPELYVPEVGEKLIEPNKILLPLEENGNMYYVASSINLEEPNNIVDSKGIFHNGGMTYVSSDHIYLCEASRDEEGAISTCIRKISYEDGKLDGKAAANVDGRLEDSFSIDEYNGYLRMVVMKDDQVSRAEPLLRELEEETAVEAEESNALYVLDQNLKIIGSIEGIAPGERIYSARFMGDTAYFVTFKETDPLFSADLSDPTNPKLIGSLKIPGFSEYLHPYGEGLLLGIGMDVDESGVTTNGVKISMFDISNPADVKEIHKTVLENVYGSAALYDYKAVLIDEEKNMIGFPTYGENEKYYVFNYHSEVGFEKVMEEEINNTSWMDVKGLYSGERLYIVGGNVIESYQIPTYKKVDDIVLQ